MQIIIALLNWCRGVLDSGLPVKAALAANALIAELWVIREVPRFFAHKRRNAGEDRLAKWLVIKAAARFTTFLRDQALLPTGATEPDVRARQPLWFTAGELHLANPDVTATLLVMLTGTAYGVSWWAHDDEVTSLTLALVMGYPWLRHALHRVPAAETWGLSKQAFGMAISLCALASAAARMGIHTLADARENDLNYVIGAIELSWALVVLAFMVVLTTRVLFGQRRGVERLIAAFGEHAEVLMTAGLISFAAASALTVVDAQTAGLTRVLAVPLTLALVYAVARPGPKTPARGR